MLKTEERLAFLVHTKNYAGNFERQMCGYCTGEVGDCEVGNEEAEVFLREVGPVFEDTILQLPDDHECYRPAGIRGYGKEANTVVFYFSERPTAEQIELMSERAKEFAECTKPDDWTGDSFITITEFELVKETFFAEKEVLYKQKVAIN